VCCKCHRVLCSAPSLVCALIMMCVHGLPSWARLWRVHCHRHLRGRGAHCILHRLREISAGASEARSILRRTARQASSRAEAQACQPRSKKSTRICTRAAPPDELLPFSTSACLRRTLHQPQRGGLRMKRGEHGQGGPCGRNAGQRHGRLRCCRASTVSMTVSWCNLLKGCAHIPPSTVLEASRTDGLKGLRSCQRTPSLSATAAHRLSLSSARKALRTPSTRRGCRRRGGQACRAAKAAHRNSTAPRGGPDRESRGRSSSP
jgi:hypothetical protein